MEFAIKGECSSGCGAKVQNKLKFGIGREALWVIGVVFVK